MHNQTSGKSRLPLLALAALGVVYGDIGTSPLYAIKEIFAVSTHPVPLTRDNVLGILSLIFWSLILVVSVKYIAFIMRANNHGEGGIMALLALASRTVANHVGKQRAIMLIGILGACMFYADGMITPAISVLSAIEGLEIGAPALHAYVIPVTLLVIFMLFWVQSKGTAIVGIFFGPVMLLWFSTLAVLGIVSVIQEPAVLQAANPYYAFHFFTTSPWIAFVALGAVVLAVTGTEALYADMGHFGRKPISVAWFGLVLPSLVLNYFGQGALILRDVASIKNPFYLLAPEWMLYPLIGLATLAAVIASQAVITGAFSISHQAQQLGFLPRMQLFHTSERIKGQIYMPRINWLLMLAVMGLVIGFKSSGGLAAAYGIAVTANMLITTLLAGVVFHVVWGWSWLRVAMLISLFLAIDLAFFTANLLKVPDGGWFPMIVGIALLTLMSTWKKGRNLLLTKMQNEAMALAPFIDSLNGHFPIRVPGNAVFMTPDNTRVPHAMLHNLKHNKILHKHVVLLTIHIEDVPYIAEEQRLVIKTMQHGLYRATMHYGFKDEPHIPRDLALCSQHGLHLEALETSYFIGKETLLTMRNSNMAYWRKKLFVGMFRNADNITNHFQLPPNRVIELGAQMTL